MIVLLPAALAGGFEVAQQSATAGGTGHASTGRDDDAAAAWFSPAALADGGGLRVAVGAAVAAARIEATGDFGETRSLGPPGTPPHLYASYARGPAVVGVAVNTAFAGGVRWPEDGPLRFESIESAPTFFRVGPFVGGRLGLVRFAAGAHVDAGSLYVHRATDHVTEEGTARIALRGAGVGGDASVFLAPAGYTIGLAYKSRSTVPLAGEADFDVPDAFAPSLADQAATASLVLPDRLALGGSVTRGPLVVLADVVLTLWSVNDELVIDFSDPATTDAVKENLWRDSVAVRTGVEIEVAPATLRAGGAVDGLGGPPAPTSTLGASSPDGTRLSATVGAGVRAGEHLRVDAFGEWLQILARETTSTDGPVATYGGRALVGGVTVGTGF